MFFRRFSQVRLTLQRPIRVPPEPTAVSDQITATGAGTAIETDHIHS
jgi:hypothetical protein